ncbi:HET-domain-containing protein, partial [Polyplosphaeria fusca]
MSIAPSGTKRLRVDADALQPEEGERDDASDPSRDSNPPSKKRFVRIHDKGGNRFFFYSCTEETELQLRSNYPGKYQFDDDDPLGAADPRKFPGVRDAVESIKPSFGGTKGGLVIVDWPLKPSDPRRIVELDPGATDSQQSLTIKGTSFWKRSPLCSRCENVVATSKVINRPWRKVNGIDTGSRDNPVTKYDETYLKYKGPKVDKYSHHETLGALRESAHAGCHLCSLFFAVDPTAPVPYDERFNEVPYFLKAIFAKDHSQGPGVLVIFPENLPSKATYMMFEEPRGHVAATLKSPCTNDEKVMDTARTWLQTCIEKHEACRIRANTSTGFIPTRLLEVNDTGSSVRLVLRSNLPSKEQYITLSHCWGKAKIIRLLESTLERFQKAIPFKRLPRNFQDAVKTTAMLGYRYIWIDSLCIIQDSSEDWKAEAAKMGAVYRHSVCTLAALGSSSSQGGCFKYR